MPRAAAGSPEIISLGEPLVEFSATDEGRLADAASFKAGCGGDTSNFAIAVCRLGGRAGYISRIGKDPLAEVLVKCWKAEGVDDAHVIRDDDACTGIYFIAREGDQHQFTYYRRDSAASRLQPADLPQDYIRAARWLHISGISQAISASAEQTVDTALAVARQAGLTVSYDPNFREALWSLEKARSVTCRTAASADILLPSYEDACQLTGETDPERIVRFYLALGPGMVVLKMGAKGALLAVAPAGKGEPPMIRHFPGFAVRTVDSSGAGDTFDAALAVAACENRPPAESVCFANAAGALAATGIGAAAPIPTREAVASLMATAGAIAS